MKASILLNHSLFATLLLSASVTVFAAGGGGPRGSGPNPWSPTGSTIERVAANTMPAGPFHAHTAPGADGSSVRGKTRAQVHAELLQAEEAGLVPIHKNDYPPSAGAIARNRVRFQQLEQAWKADGQVTASDQ